jgi:hypothetical protein
MFRIMVAGLLAVVVGAAGGLILFQQASVEAGHSTVTIDRTTTSAPLSLAPTSAPAAIQRTRTVPLPISTEVPLPVQEVTSADETPEHASSNRRRHRLTARSAPAGVVHYRRSYGSADDDDGEDD